MAEPPIVPAASVRVPSVITFDPGRFEWTCDFPTDGGPDPAFNPRLPMWRGRPVPVREMTTLIEDWGVPTMD